MITESQSLWNSPLVVVCKKTLDRSIQIRCCLDLHGVNKLIKVAPYQEQLQPHETIALNFQLAWQNARDNLQQHQRHKKQHYDKTAIPSRITPGSKVLIRRNMNKPGLSSKLTNQFTGPF